MILPLQWKFDKTSVSKINLSRETDTRFRCIADTVVYLEQQSFHSHSVQCGVVTTHERDTAYNRHNVARITEQAKFQDDCCVCTSLPIIPALFRQTQTEADIPDDFLWDPRYPFILYVCLFRSLANLFLLSSLFG